MSVDPTELGGNDQSSFFDRNRWTIVGAGALVLGGIGYYVYKKRSTSSSSSGVSPIYVTPSSSSLPASASSGSSASVNQQLWQNQLAMDSVILNSLQQTGGASNSTTAPSATGSYTPSSSVNAVAPAATIQPTGLPVTTAVANGYQQTVANAVAAGYTQSEANQIATNAENFQALSQAQKTYDNLIAAGYTPSQAQSIAGT